MVGEDGGSVRRISRLLSIGSQKRWRGGGASMEPAPDSWPEPVITRSPGKDPGLPFQLFSAVLLQLRLEVSTELVESTACGIV